MKPYQRQFIEFALSKQVLKFGEFTLKSGRKSPYFFNAGLFNTGRDLALLGRFYAEALVDSGIEFDLLFGPAYKGIPIATTTAVALAEHHDLDLPYCFNRKEAKDHGEGGNLVGSALQGRIMLVDDVITAGNGYIVRTLDSADKDIAAESVGNLRYTHSVKLKFRKNLEFKKLYTATCKGVDLDC